MPFEPISAVYRSGAAVVRVLPPGVSRAGAAVGAVAIAELSRERRLLVERNLRRVHGPGLTGRRLRRAVHATFRSYARYWVDSFRLPELSVERIDAGFGFEGYGHIAEARAAGVGPILVLPHVGGWEWAAFWLTRVVRVPVTVVVEPVEPPELFEFFLRFRRTLGMHIVPLGPDAGRVLLRAIRDRHVVCLLADRDIAGDGLPVRFFGEETTLPAGPATLALRTGAPLLPTAVYFTDRGHHGVVRPPIPVERRGRFRADVARITQTLAEELEALIRVAPEQWHLQQPNWPSDYEALAALGTPPPGLGPATAGPG